MRWLLLLGTLSCTSLAELPPPQPLPKGAGFAGEWDSSFGHLRLEKREDWLFGTWGEKGAMFGYIKGNQFRFNWRDHAAGNWGKGYFLMSRDGTRLEGQYGSKKDELGEGVCWARRKATKP